VQRIRYNRRNERYRSAHTIADYILRGLGFEDIYSQSEGQIFTFLVNMNDVFEQFVERLIRDACMGTSMVVRSQERFGKVIRNLDTGRTYSSIRPDLMVRAAETGFPVDTKYKRYDLRKVSTGDIYQTFLYAFSLSKGLPEPRALVIFPSDGPSSGHRLAVRSVHDPQEAMVSAIGIDMPKVLDGIGTANFASTLASLRGSLLRVLDAESV
jgi:5-methylcytosine-specific restriction enzyme subunit McrC